MNERFTREPGHGKLIPTGSSLAEMVRNILANDAYHAFRLYLANGIRPNLTPIVNMLAEAAKPLVTAYYTRGKRTQAMDLLRQIAGRTVRRRKSLESATVTKAFGGKIDISFNLFNPEVADYVTSAVRVFAQSTLETAVTDAATAYQRFRDELREGLIKGEPTVELSRRIVQIFNDPYRAWRAAQTEAHRAVHAGQYAVDERHGVEGVEWLASADACDVCRKLNGQRRKIGVPFLTKTTGPEVYRKVFFPGAHPGCMCSYKSIINMDDVTPQVVESLRQEARVIA